MSIFLPSFEATVNNVVDGNVPEEYLGKFFNIFSSGNFDLIQSVSHRCGKIALTISNKIRYRGKVLN